MKKTSKKSGSGKKSIRNQTTSKIPKVSGVIIKVIPVSRLPKFPVLMQTEYRLN